MKKAYVQVERVRDCPDWCDGECNHIDNENGICEKNEIAFPPDNCPLDNV